MSESKVIGFDRRKLQRLHEAYDKARNEQAESFTFEGGSELLTDYAKYLLEYLDNLNAQGRLP